MNNVANCKHNTIQQISKISEKQIYKTENTFILYIYIYTREIYLALFNWGFLLFSMMFTLLKSLIKLKCLNLFGKET